MSRSLRTAIRQVGSVHHSPTPLTLSVLPGRAYSAQPISPVLSQLQRVAELQQRVSAENSKQRKGEIITEYPDLRELLEQ